MLIIIMTIIMIIIMFLTHSKYHNVHYHDYFGDSLRRAVINKMFLTASGNLLRIYKWEFTHILFTTRVIVIITARVIFVSLLVSDGCLQTA